MTPFLSRPSLLVNLTPFQSLRLAGRLLGHVVHWLERSGNTFSFFPSSHSIYYLRQETPRTQKPVLAWTLTYLTWAETELAHRRTQAALFLSVWELLRGLVTRVTQMFLLAPRQVVAGRLGVGVVVVGGVLSGIWGGVERRCGGEANGAPEPGWELPLWDTKHCLCWERPWGWEHRPELDTERRF